MKLFILLFIASQTAFAGTFLEMDPQREKELARVEAAKPKDVPRKPAGEFARWLSSKGRLRFKGKPEIKGAGCKS